MTFTDAEIANMSLKDVCHHLGISQSHASRVRAKAREREGWVATKVVWTHPVPDDFAERAKTMRMLALSRHYGRDPKTISRWAKKLGITIVPRPTAKPVTKKLGTVKGRFVLPGVKLEALPDGSTEGLAADYLRRKGYRNVHRCDLTGRWTANGRYWRAGNVVLTGDQLMDRARAKGWEPDEWRRIAA